jgi:hypothetical protein
VTASFVSRCGDVPRRLGVLRPNEIARTMSALSITTAISGRCNVMFALTITAMWPSMFLCLASPTSESPWAGPSSRRIKMSANENLPRVPERTTAATTRPTTVPLNEFVLKPELYCHRDPAELTERERLKPLMDSIKAHGLLNPVEFYRGPDGEPIPDEGHRRISGLRFLVEDRVSGFTATMPIPSVEVIGARGRWRNVGTVVRSGRSAFSLSGAECAPPGAPAVSTAGCPACRNPLWPLRASGLTRCCPDRYPRLRAWPPSSTISAGAPSGWTTPGRSSTPKN